MPVAIFVSDNERREDRMANLYESWAFKVKSGSEGLNLRSEPTTKATTKNGKGKNIILSIPNGAKVTLESMEVKTVEKHTWYNVKYTDKDKKVLTGWVASDYLELLTSSLPTLSYSALWNNHPGHNSDPCDINAFPNQCAIRMGIALEKSGVDLSTFQGERCWQKLDEKHDRRHILRAQELADWLSTQTILVGKVQISKPGPSATYEGKRGIVFFQNLTDSPEFDHIDVWSGHMNVWNWKGARRDFPYLYFERCNQVWFWDLCPTTAQGNVAAYSKPDVTSSFMFGTDPSISLEVVEVQENWVQVKSNTGSVGFIERDAILFPGQKMGYTLRTKVGEILKDTGAVQVLERYPPDVSKNPMFATWAEGMDLKGLLAQLMEWGETGTLKELLAKVPAKNAGLTEDMVLKVLAEINARK
jgi:hypothetical protein